MRMAKRHVAPFPLPGSIPSPLWGGLSHMAVKPKFPLSVSGYALDTSPPRGVEEGRELAMTGTLPRPLQGERCQARRARRRGGVHTRFDDTIYAALADDTPTPYPSPQGGGDFGKE